MKILRLATLLVASGLLGLASARAEAHWLTDFHQAQEEAKASHKLLLIDFTGSDWCPWCQVLHAEVFSKPEFEQYAKDNLVLMTVDFPRTRALSSEVRQQNQALGAALSGGWIPDDCGPKQRGQTSRPAWLHAGWRRSLYQRVEEAAEELDSLNDCRG